VNDTTVTATFNIGAATAAGARNISVTTPNGVTNTVTFTVVAPALTAIAPVSGLRGTSVPVTLTGVDLTGATAVHTSAPNITVSSFTAVNATTVTATFNIAAATAPGAKTVTVTTPTGTTNAETFTVLAPTVTALSPNSGTRGTSVNVTFTGTNLTGATGVSGFGTLITVSNFKVVSATTVTATFNIGATAPTGVRNISLTTTSNGSSNTVPFTVN